MPNITLKAIEQLLDLKLEEKLDLKIAPVQKTLNHNSLVLDQVAKQTKDWNAEMTIMRDRMEKYEKALKQMAKKLNYNIDPLLN